MENFLIFLASIRWQDIVDIILVSYILFRLYILFKGTYVFRVLIGIALLVFFQRIAVFLGLIVTSWAIQGITAVAAFIIIVVFRNEIRNVLQAKKLRAIFWGFSPKTVKTPIEIIIESVFELSKKHIGALIVFPGREDIEEIVQNGTPWHGFVSKEMIMSIFWHDNPVHDGAIIVRGDKITEVRVILPLSMRQNLPSNYGTRHRAAAGLAESTDALVIVVSEERGSIIVAKGSSMKIIKRKNTLSQILLDHIDVTKKEWSYLQKEKFQTGLAALVSILIITGVWFSFTRGVDTLVALEIPVEYMNRDQGMEILDTSINSIRLNLSGSGTLIKSIRSEQVHVKLDLSKAVVGRNTFTITHEDITLPPGIFLKGVQPSVVEVNLDIPIKKELPVQLDWTGKLPKHLILAEAKLNIEKIEVVGGTKILENISTIYTKKIPLDKIKRPGTITVGLAINPASIKIAPGSKDKITVDYIVKKRYK